MSNLASRLVKALKGRFNKEAFPPVPAPKSDPDSLYNSVNKIKTGYEVLTRTRGEVGDSAILVKELDFVFTELVAILDQRYGKVPDDGSDTVSEVRGLIDGFENLITTFASHVGDESIHGGSETIINETIVNELPVHDCMDCIDDGSVVVNKAWSGAKLDGQLGELSGYMHYEGEWDSTVPLYTKGSTVRIRSTWTMTAIVDTEEPAEPLQTGPRVALMPDNPTWVEKSFLGPVFSGVEITFISEGWFGGLEIWAPDVGPDVYHYIVVLDVTNPATPVYHAVNYPTLVPDEWSSVALSNIFVAPGARFYLYLAAVETSDITNWTGQWSYIGAGANKAPKAGEYANGKNMTELRLSLLDDAGVDRTADLVKLTAGAEIEFTQNNDATKRDKFRIISAPVLVASSKGDYYQWAITHIDEANGGPSGGNLADAVATIFEPTVATSYVEENDTWALGGQPGWALIQGYLFEGGSPNPTSQPTNNNGYGINIRFTPGRVSPDWGVLAYSPSPAEE